MAEQEAVVPADQEAVVPPIQEEAAGTSQEGVQEVGIRGRVRGRGRGGRGGGRDRAGAVRQEVRAPNCLPVCPVGCRGLGPKIGMSLKLKCLSNCKSLKLEWLSHWNVSQIKTSQIAMSLKLE